MTPGTWQGPVGPALSDEEWEELLGELDALPGGNQLPRYPRRFRFTYSPFPGGEPRTFTCRAWDEGDAWAEWFRIYLRSPGAVVTKIEDWRGQWVSICESALPWPKTQEQGHSPFALLDCTGLIDKR